MSQVLFARIIMFLSDVFIICILYDLEQKFFWYSFGTSDSGFYCSRTDEKSAIYPDTNSLMLFYDLCINWLIFVLNNADMRFHPVTSPNTTFLSSAAKEKPAFRDCRIWRDNINMRNQQNSANNAKINEPSETCQEKRKRKRRIKIMGKNKTENTILWTNNTFT